LLLQLASGSMNDLRLYLKHVDESAQWATKCLVMFLHEGFHRVAQ
jgi:hypothetical protein